MTANKEVKVKTEGRTLFLSREFDAPRDLVFETFSDCEQLQHWWSPKGWSLTHCDMDFRPGGRWHYCMSSDTEDIDSWGLQEFEQIERPEMIKYTDHFADEEGNKNMEMPAAHSVVRFSENNGVTTLVSTTEYGTEEELNKVLEMGMVDGVTETWAKLEALLAKKQS